MHNIQQESECEAAVWRLVCSAHASKLQQRKWQLFTSFNMSRQFDSRLLVATDRFTQTLKHARKTPAFWNFIKFEIVPLELLEASDFASLWTGYDPVRGSSFRDYCTSVDLSEFVVEQDLDKVKSAVQSWSNLCSFRSCKEGAFSEWSEQTCFVHSHSACIECLSLKCRKDVSVVYDTTSPRSIEDLSKFQTMVWNLRNLAQEFCVGKFLHNVDGEILDDGTQTGMLCMQKVLLSWGYLTPADEGRIRRILHGLGGKKKSWRTDQRMMQLSLHLAKARLNLGNARFNRKETAEAKKQLMTVDDAFIWGVVDHLFCKLHRLELKSPRAYHLLKQTDFCRYLESVTRQGWCLEAALSECSSTALHLVDGLWRYACSEREKIQFQNPKSEVEV